MRPAVVTSLLVLHLAALSAPAPSGDIESVVSRNRELSDLLIPLLQANLEAMGLDQAGHDQLLNVLSPKHRKDKSVVELVPIRSGGKTRNRKRPLALIVASQMPKGSDKENSHAYDNDQNVRGKYQDDASGDTDVVKLRRKSNNQARKSKTSPSLDENIKKSTYLTNSKASRSDEKQEINEDDVSLEENLDKRESSIGQYGHLSGKSETKESEETNFTKKLKNTNSTLTNVVTNTMKINHRRKDENTSDNETERYDAEAENDSNKSQYSDNDDVTPKEQKDEEIDKQSRSEQKKNDSGYALSNERLVVDFTEDVSKTKLNNPYIHKNTDEENITSKTENETNKILEVQLTEASYKVKNEKEDQGNVTLENATQGEIIGNKHSEQQNHQESSKEEMTDINSADDAATNKDVTDVNVHTNKDDNRHQQYTEEGNLTSETDATNEYLTTTSDKATEIDVETDTSERDLTVKTSEKDIAIENEQNKNITVEDVTTEKVQNTDLQKEHEIYKHKNLEVSLFRRIDQEVKTIASEIQSSENESYEDITIEHIGEEDTSEKHVTNEIEPNENITEDYMYDDYTSKHVSEEDIHYSNHHGSPEKDYYTSKTSERDNSDVFTIEDYTNDNSNRNLNQHKKYENTGENIPYESFEIDSDVINEDLTRKDEIYENLTEEDLKNMDSSDDDDENILIGSESYETDRSDEDYTNEEVTSENLTNENFIDEGVINENLTEEDITNENLTEEDETNENLTVEDVSNYENLTGEDKSNYENLTDEDVTNENLTEDLYNDNLTGEDLTRDSVTKDFIVKNDSEEKSSDVNNNLQLGSQFLSVNSIEGILDLINYVKNVKLRKNYNSSENLPQNVKNDEKSLNTKTKICKNKLELGEFNKKQPTHDSHKSYKLSFMFN